MQRRPFDPGTRRISFEDPNGAIPPKSEGRHEEFVVIELTEPAERFLHVEAVRPEDGVEFPISSLPTIGPNRAGRVLVQRGPDQQGAPIRLDETAKIVATPRGRWRPQRADLLPSVGCLPVTVDGGASSLVERFPDQNLTILDRDRRTKFLRLKGRDEHP